MFKYVTLLLVLHPIVAILSFVGMISSLWLASHTVLMFSFTVTITNTILSLVIFSVDLAIHIAARENVPLVAENLAISWGNGVWMVLTGVLMSGVGVILLSIPVRAAVLENYHPWATLPGGDQPLPVP
jgi:hypothetical protein